MTTMNHPQCRRGTELGPIRRTREPWKIISYETIDGRSCMHVCVGESDCGMENRITCFEGVADFVEDQDIGFAASEEEVYVHADGDFAGEDPREI
jgi:hypothetical protein